MSLKEVKTEHLPALAINVKGSIMEGINHEEVETFHLGVGMLQKIEDEIRSRGLDPSDPIFGPDLMAEIVQIKIDLLTR